METVHLLRHGEVFNPDQVLYGRLPGYRLSELGHAQAELAARWLTERDPAVLLSSPLDRARQTATAVADRTGLDVEVDERLIEGHNRLEGRRVAGGRGLFRDVRHWRWFVNPFRPSWGEPYVEIAGRMSAVVDAARARIAGTGRDAVCVSHQLPIVMARRRAEGRPLFHNPRRRRCNLASVTSFTFDGERLIRVGYAEPAAAAGLPQGEGTGA